MLAIAIVYNADFRARGTRPGFVGQSDGVHHGARSMACRGGLLWRHVLPNTLAPLIVQVSLALLVSLLTEAGLSFLAWARSRPLPRGASSQREPGLAKTRPWLMLFPRAAIMTRRPGFNLLGDGLRDILDPPARAG